MNPTATPSRHAGTKRAASKARQKERSFKQSAAGRAMAILQTVSATDSAISAAELFPALGIPKPTIHRLMLLLEELAFLEREPGSKRFIAGAALTRMAIDTLIFSPNRSIRHGILQALVDEVQETCNVTMLAGNEVVYVDRVEAHWPLRYHLQQGSRVPMHCSASGRLFLSFMPARKRHALLSSHSLKRYTQNTIVDPILIEKGLKAVRASGISLDVEEFMEGLIGVAVPVFDGQNRICATVSMHAPTVRCSPEKALTYARKLKRAALAIGATLGGVDKI